MKHSLVIRIALLLAFSLGLLAPASFAIAAPTHDVNDDVNGGPVGGIVDDSDNTVAPEFKRSKIKKSKVQKSSTNFSSKKHSAKKASTKKLKSSKLPRKQGFLKAPKAAMQGQARPIYGTPDPNVAEPSEMITEIKNNAQDKFWAGKRPYPEQLRERSLTTPPSAPVLTGAIAQKELQKRGTLNGAAVDQSVAHSNSTHSSNTLRRVSFSEISGVTFDDQPLRLSASEPFRRSLDTVSFELGRPCKNQEYLGWPMQQSEQTRVDHIFEATNERLKLRGYNLQPQKARSVGSDVSAFTADNGDKRLLGIWSAGDVGLLLLMCDSETPQELAYAAKMKHQNDFAALKKSKTKTVKPKKKSKKVTTKKAHTLFKANTPAAQPSPSTTSFETGNSPIGNSTAGSATQPDAPTKPAADSEDPNAAPLGTKAPQADVAPAPVSSVPTTATPLVPAPADDSRPQVIPGAPPKDLPPEPTQSRPQSSAVPSAINPSTAFIPADVPSAAKDATKDAIKDVAPSMKALPPEVAPPPVSDVKP